MAKLFTIAAYKALAFRLDDKRFKFVGGKLVVQDEDVEAVRKFAANRPEYQIAEVEGDYVEPVVAPVVVDDDAQKMSVADAVAAGNKTEPGAPMAPDQIPAMSPQDAGNATETTDPVQPQGDAGQPEADADATDEANDAGDVEDAEKPAFNEDAARDHFGAMKNDEIRKILEDEGANVSGNHAELVDRVVALAKEKFEAEEAADDNEANEADETE